MCEYCHKEWGIKDMRYIEEKRVDPRFTDGRTMKVATGSYQVFHSMNIRFCPMCGRKLTEDK